MSHIIVYRGGGRWVALLVLGSLLCNPASVVLGQEQPLAVAEAVRLDTPVEDIPAVETGDATALLDINNEVNESYTAAPLSGEATLAASTTNDALVVNEATTSATTGGNDLGDVSVATIVTGDSIAVANVVNLVNTNILNSVGLIEFFTALGLSTIDVRGLFDIFTTDTAVSTANCTSSACGDEQGFVETNATNTASITNTVVVRADTGSNTSGGGSIETGDAYAVANVVNVANTTITDSNYLLVTVNNLGNLTGDMVLPTASLLEQLFARGGTTQVDSSTNNTATIDNTLTVVADTGNNTAEGGSIETGDAVATGNVHTDVNHTSLGGASFTILLRVHGTWSGSIYGLPQSLTWSEEGGRITIHTEGENGGGSSGGITANTHNIASIMNNISVYALTGDNKVSGEGSIETGNAHASAQVTNLANLNILSQNWALLIFDIFGDWSGNITFGRPDLWVGAAATPVSARLYPGDMVDYTLTVSNIGDTPATNVVLEGTYNDNFLTPDSTAGGSTAAAGEETLRRWSLGTLAPGATKEIHYRATVSSALSARTQNNIPLAVAVSANETEDNLTNNSDTIALTTEIRRGGGGNGRSTEKAAITISKRVLSSITTVPALVEYEITLENTGGTLYNATLGDTLTDADGNTVYEGYWNLEHIKAGETITVSYAVDFASSTKPGVYQNRAQVQGTHRSSQITSINQYQSPVASTSLTVLAGQVLGLSTCGEYLTSPLRLGYANDAQEVEKLQAFLAAYLKTSLPITGTFDSNTYHAVTRFQQQHQDEVLDPWGLRAPTGYVYITTRQTINEIYCGRAVTFPLSVAEEAILTAARSR